ncbi:ABC-2 type transport system permease protein [Paenimyroides aquimaris]|uniref:ABC-2 type transport system permease protein n=1 Tax=Paenimyroides marinum TaxID=1159016 RepID=A0A1H6LV14_9FLAO|nr:ABC transporter permease [Paenimyroides aquimaris]SEH88898.1 ABC-2 type transport system permease protein [Paenimyroides aquimaris]
MGVLSLIIKREFISKVRNKSFIVMTFVSPLIFVAVAALIGYLSSMKTEVKHIGIHDESGMFVNDFKSNESYKYHDVSKIDPKILKDSVSQANYEGILFIPSKENLKDYEEAIEYVSEDSPSIGFIADVESKLSDKLMRQNLSSKGIDTVLLDQSKIDVTMHLTKASGEETVKGLNEMKVAIGSAFGYLIMMFIIIYGNMVMRSVIEEKTNRIIEIIVSSIKPIQLMMGKIIGTTFAGILQFVIWAIVGMILLVIANTVFGLNTSTPTTELAMETAKFANVKVYFAEFLKLPLLSMIAYFLIYFIGGYFLYSSLYAAIGAAVDNETDTQQFMFPVIMPLMLGVYIGFFTVMNEPHGTVATIFSMIPFTSPIVMLMRIPFGVPFYQIALSIALLFATFIAIVWVASKIYRVGILMYGKKPTWKELVKWLKY